MKVYISSDFLMTKEKEQFNNLRWFWDLLRRPISQVLNEQPIKFISSLTKEDYFSRIKFFDKSNIKLDVNELQFYFDSKKISSDSIGYLKDFLGEGNLIVGYELSEQTRRILTQANIIYIDIWLHPIRFMDDILFGFSSNNTEIFEKLKEYNLDSNLYGLYADRLKIQTYKGFKRNELNIAPNSALFVGQTLLDKAICKNGKMLTVLDFKDEFETAGKLYSKIYYSRHPYVKSGDEDIVKYLKSLPFVEIVDWPIYNMLASDNLRYVFSVSSSVVHEAKAFNKKTKFLFKPIFHLNAEYSINNYISVYQEFISPHFWSNVLNPVVQTKEAPKLAYLDGKDKLRDMLAFYWSYGAIDKVEMIRKQLNAVDNIVQKIRNGKETLLENKVKKKIQIERIDEKNVKNKLVDQIKKHDIISFDIFDTLLVRPFAKPDDMFIYMQPEVDKISSNLSDFRKIRLEAKKLVHLEEHIGEEVPLFARYVALGRNYDLSNEQVIALYNLELETEKKILRPRKIAVDLFNEAKKLGKKVIITSDTFFEKAFIEQVLSMNDIKGYDLLFVSSQHGLLKATGNVYPYLLKKLNSKPSKILHIGDNHAVDIVNANKYEISTLHLESTVKNFEKKSLLGKQIKHNSVLIRSIVQGLIANKISDNPLTLQSPSYINGSFYNFGYAFFGPILLGFSKWLIEISKKDNIDHLYFLSRDGDIVNKACDLFKEYIDDLPTFSYLYGSRRGVNIPAITSKENIIDLLDVNFTPMPIGLLLEQRFGIKGDIINNEIYQKYGFKDNIKHRVRFKEDNKILKEFISEISDLILDSAKLEREILVKYYNDQGLFKAETKKAIVDIGHNGTMQKSIMNLCNNSNNLINGYYFVTYDGIKDLTKNNIWGKGYLAEMLNHKHTDHPYVRFILMFEMLFLNDQGSFVKMSYDGKNYIPIKLPLIGEENRIEMIREIHKGGLDFLRDVLNLLGSKIIEYDFNGMELINPYIQFLKEPAIIDVEIFKGVLFENYYSGRSHRAVVENILGESPIWKEGADLLSLCATSDSSSDKYTVRMLEMVAEKANEMGLLSASKLEKLHRNPKAFFEDSSSIAARLVGKGLKKWL